MRMVRTHLLRASFVVTVGATAGACGAHRTSGESKVGSEASGVRSRADEALATYQRFIAAYEAERSGAAGVREEQLPAVLERRSV